MEYNYRTIAITIGFKTFDLEGGNTMDQVFAYAEEKFGFNGDEWDEIKENFETEDMGKLIEGQGEEYSEVIGC